MKTTSSRDWRYWRNLLIFGVLVLAIIFAAGIIALSRQSAHNYLYPPRYQRAADDTPSQHGVSYQNIRLETAEGVSLAAWYTPPKNGAVILNAHGHACARLTEMYALFARNGYGVLAWDFRGHGESEETLCSLGYREALDVEAALDYVLSSPEGVEHVGAWGASMGGAAVLEAAARREEIEAIVVDSTFPTLEDEFEHVIPMAALRPLIRFFAERETGLKVDVLRPVDRIGELSPRPIFLIYGEADGAIPPGSGPRMYEAAGEPKALWMEPDVGHVGMYGAFPEEYEQRVVEFFDEALLEQD